MPHHAPREIVGYHQTETLEFERTKLRVRVTKYPKYACSSQPECGVAQAPRPASPVEGNRNDTSVAAEIAVAKYGYLLAMYQRLNQIEAEARRAQSQTIMDEIRTWLDSKAAQRVLPKSRLRVAVRYLRNRWGALTVFLRDGAVPFDNNPTE